MRAVIQRVREARVEVEGKTVGAIGAGLLVFLGVEAGDGQADLEYICRKLLGLRIFEDETGRMNCDIIQAAGEILLISQFTLLGDARHGRRPDYMKAAGGEEARVFYEAAGDALAKAVPVQRGIFGADMQVFLQNDGPVTILLDSKKTF